MSEKRRQKFVDKVNKGDNLRIENIRRDKKDWGNGRDDRAENEKVEDEEKKMWWREEMNAKNKKKQDEMKKQGGDKAMMQQKKR